MNAGNVCFGFDRFHSAFGQLSIATAASISAQGDRELASRVKKLKRRTASQVGKSTFVISTLPRPTSLSFRSFPASGRSRTTSGNAATFGLGVSCKQKEEGNPFIFLSCFWFYNKFCNIFARYSLLLPVSCQSFILHVFQFLLAFCFFDFNDGDKYCNDMLSNWCRIWVSYSISFLPVSEVSQVVASYVNLNFLFIGNNFRWFASWPWCLFPSKSMTLYVAAKHEISLVA